MFLNVVVFAKMESPRSSPRAAARARPYYIRMPLNPPIWNMDSLMLINF